MIALTLKEVAEVTGGRLHRATGDETVTGTVEFDSRAVGPGGLFVAVPGARVDGHDFAARAVEAGAVAVLAAREVDAPAVVVPPVAVDGPSRVYALAGDTDGSGAAVLAGLAALAREVARRLTAAGMLTVGVTGSAGKTSTKDLIAALLAARGATVAPPGSFNNEIGHPWTVLRADEHTRHLVLELSARGAGHIAALCDVAPPRIGAVLNVGTSHVDEFGSQEAIAQAKGELVEALPEDGVAVLNADDPYVSAMAGRTKARVLTFGLAEHADVRGTEVELDARARPSFTLVTEAGAARVDLRLHGAHQVANALAAAAVALAAGMPLADVATGLSTARAVSARRMAVETTDDGVTVVNDAYNASPEATREALKTLVTISRSGNGRAWAVLGPLAELGAEHDRVHEEIGRLAASLAVHRLVVVGAAAQPMHRGASLAGSCGEEPVLVSDVDAAVDLLRAELRAGDVVLVKAANARRLWRIADALLGSRA
ncbi:UDP-N-acetylmuramoyl-tripeptide--D-alanyl-D-alanine ligase [Actinophytocola glycyrrhizae]|uniref:UDP-N-acetylmuramoyl-tripeptide--D-alanyl-D-alanine ligase n=1 Tax=Actinophytocola glycyrrhizae TaxID=2044873 RepID=A0ABV9S560_9PSEU